MEDKNIYRKWYLNENIEIRNFIHWEIFKDSGAKRHTSDFILAGKEITLIHRFYPIGKFYYMRNQLIKRFENEKEPSFHVFRSHTRIKFVGDDEKPIELKKEWKDNMFGFDLIFDIDNKHFKKWWNKEGSLNHPDILKVVAEGLPEVYSETKIIKKFLDTYSIPYILNFSGTGFRICIEWDDIKDYFTLQDYGTITTQFIEWVLNKSNPKKEGGNNYKSFGEIQTGFALTRVLFSIHPLSKLICFPLNGNEFENFNLDMVNPENRLKSIKIVKSSNSLNKKRDGSFKRIFEDFKKDVKIDELHQQKQAEIKTIKNNEIKSKIFELYKQLPEDERKVLIEEL